MEPVLDRLGRVLRLEQGVYAEIAADERSTGHAVVVSAAAFAIGNLTADGGFVTRIAGGAVGGVLGLFVWTGILFVLSKLFQGRGSYTALARGIGYAAAPFALGVVPLLGFVGMLYSAVLQIRAVREIQQVPGGAAAAIVLIPWAFFLLVIFIALATLVSLLFGVDLD